MHTLLFEMKPLAGHEEHYFSHVAKLRPILLQQEGLLFVHRYKSLSRPDIILSHSLWRDEAAITQWRANKEHRKSQIAGRKKHFEDYRIRISHAIYCHPVTDHLQHTEEIDASSSIDNATGRFLAIIRSTSVPINAIEEIYESVNEASSYLYVSEHAKQQEGLKRCLAAQRDDDTKSTILARVSRNYSMYDRDEAPEY